MYTHLLIVNIYKLWYIIIMNHFSVLAYQDLKKAIALICSNSIRVLEESVKYIIIS